MMMRMSGTSRFVALFFLLPAVALGLCAQSTPPNGKIDQPSSEIPPQFIQMLKTQVVWDDGFNHPTGPRLRFVKVGEIAKPDGRFSQYRIYAEGIPEGVPYIFADWKIGTYLENLHVASSSAYVNRRGLLLTKKPGPENEDQESVNDGTEFDVAVQAAVGEPIRFLLRSQDNQILIPGTLVPFPIESADHGCKLTALLAVPEGQAILIYGDGFVPGSEVVIHGDSSGELKESSHAVDERGHFEVVELPGVIGKDAGVLKDTITTKECTVSVSIPWGKGTYQKH